MSATGHPSIEEYRDPNERKATLPEKRGALRPLAFLVEVYDGPSTTNEELRARLADRGIFVVDDAVYQLHEGSLRLLSAPEPR